MAKAVAAVEGGDKAAPEKPAERKAEGEPQDEKPAESAEKSDEAKAEQEPGEPDDLTELLREQRERFHEKKGTKEESAPKEQTAKEPSVDELYKKYKDEFLDRYLQEMDVDSGSDEPQAEKADSPEVAELKQRLDEVLEWKKQVEQYNAQAKIERDVHNFTTAVNQLAKESAEKYPYMSTLWEGNNQLRDYVLQHVVEVQQKHGELPKIENVLAFGEATLKRQHSAFEKVQAARKQESPAPSPQGRESLDDLAPQSEDASKPLTEEEMLRDAIRAMERAEAEGAR